MNYLSGALSYIAGNDEPPSPSSSSTTSAISRLVDRTASSALPADRRSAVAALAELALRGPDAQREIGSRGIKVLYAVIEQDGAHEDTVTAALTLLARICGVLPPPPSPPDAGRSAGAEDSSDGEAGAGGGRRKGGARDSRPPPSVSWTPEEAASVAADNSSAWVAMDGLMDLVLDAVEADDAATRAAALDVLAALLGANAAATVPRLLDASPPPAGRLLEATRDSAPGVRLRSLGFLAAAAGASSAVAAVLAAADGYERLLDVADTCVDNALHKGGPAETAHQAALLTAAVTAVNATLAAGGAAGAAAARRCRAVPRLGVLLRSAAAGLREAPPAPPPALLGTSAGGGGATGPQLDTALALLHTVSLLVAADGGGTRDECLSAGLTAEVLALAFDQGGDGRPGSGTSGAPPGGVPPLPPDVRVAALMATAALARGHPPTHTLFPTTGILPPPDTPHSVGLAAVGASSYACVRAASLR